MADKPTDTVRNQTSYAVTSLPADRADARLQAGYPRGHWGIENRLHWIRDVAYDEDMGQVRSGNAPQFIAALRNMAISVMRLSGYDSIAEAIRHYAARQIAATFLVRKSLRIPPK